MFAVVFDMDGVIVDNGEFHYLAWKRFCYNHQIPFSKEKFRKAFFGRINEQVLPILFNKELTKDEIQKLGSEKEKIYREIYKPELKPVPGLVLFLNELKENNIPVAVATSASPENVDFVLDGLNIKYYFDVIVDDSMVTKGKPDPEIYLKAAQLLKKASKNCIVFEDSLSGTKAALDAGSKVVAITTSLKADEHKYAKHIFSDFSEISLNFICTEIFN
ncbi:beta-phosphoglucomutase family hydrolase [Maribellus comscasis]|uniref:Beta-phosphoglucomutase n=1 Tax=Maribellus comscasis TaxID=2681766 RepID=A0A6I6JX85_9BACT|nr:HAD family phosphatase [Maribellus comscasis]QGY43743.1 beta-phosphoglucomutase family hydrolase [Maribellus comscasis]